MKRNRQRKTPKHPMTKPTEMVTNPSNPPSRAVLWLLPLGLTLLVGMIYLLTLLPGVDSGDSAELQYKSPLLGICHPPGYQIELCFGKLFSYMPFGSDVAWRINFMMAAAGVIGVLALYGAIRRITGSFIAALVGALTLAFSSIYWTHSLMAEAYVFYGSFLVLGIYAAVRFIQSNRAVWLYLTCLFLGVAVADRASELFVMPGFLVLAWAMRKKFRLTWLRLLGAIIFFILPFFFTVGYVILRHNASLLHSKGDIRDAILNDTQKGPPEEVHPLTIAQKLSYPHLRNIIRTCLGLGYAKDAKFDSRQVAADVDKYAWLLSGLGARGERYPPENVRGNLDQGRGTSISLLGVILALLGAIFWRRQYGWAALGVILVGGNLFFILWHHRWDNLTFTVPSLIGWSLLVGLGAAGPQNHRLSGKKLITLSLVCLIAPLFLLVTNYNLVNRNTLEEKQRQEYLTRLSQADFPHQSVILATTWPAMTYRYLFYIEAKRYDMYIMKADQRDWKKLIEYFRRYHRPVFIEARQLDPKSQKLFLARTPPAVAAVGFVQL